MSAPASGSRVRAISRASLSVGAEYPLRRGLVLAMICLVVAIDLRPRPVARRVGVAGIFMIVTMGPVVVLPAFVVAGGDLSRGIGGRLLNSREPYSVTASMLPWLWPVAVLTVTAGVLLIRGHALRFGLSVALGWVAIGVINMRLTRQIELLGTAVLVALLIVTGRRSFVPN